MALTLKVIKKDIPAAGTAVALSSSPLYCSSFRVYAKSANTNNVYVGDSTVDNTWEPIAAGGSISFENDDTSKEEFDLSTIYVDADTNGNDVIVTYVARS